MNPSQKENQMNKLIFASLLSVGAILAAQTPAAPAPAPAASAKTTVEGQDQQEASQQENNRGEQQQRQTRRQVTAERRFGRDFRARSSEHIERLADPGIAF